jgi:monoamine oxidase
MAGTSAASKLAEGGKKVLILEANDYIGGRMKT